VHPIFFPGGSIADLAVNGTVNDLAMCGARPLYLSAGFILEEGLPMETLWRVVQSMQQAAEAADVQIVTGDTKVVDRGKGDGIFINTAGVGLIEHDRQIAPGYVRPGDLAIINGDIGRHGIAIMAVREGLDFESAIESDTAPLAGIVLKLLEANIDIHCLRDLTRGGLASALAELAAAAAVRIQIDEAELGVLPSVSAVCDLLGLDPLYVANEGRFVAIVHPDDCGRALQSLRGHAVSAQARRIGEVQLGRGDVIARTALGTSRVLDLLAGAQLPRIC
jgi:hydrogenase expression/formation protein HypE